METIEEKQIEIDKEKISDWYLETFPTVAAFIRKQGGSLDEAREIFQEAIIIYYEKLISTKFTPEQSDQAYLFGITKKRWFKHCSTKKYTDHIDSIDVVEEQERQLNTQKLLNHLKSTGKKCMDMLQAFYYERLSMTQMANRFGFRSERSATVQKYKCLEKVREQVKLKALTYEDFLN